LVATTVDARLCATLGLLALATVMRATQARWRARHPRTAEKRPHSGAHPPHLPVGSVASTRDNLIRCRLVPPNDVETSPSVSSTLRAAVPQHAIVGRESGRIVREIAGGGSNAHRRRCGGCPA